MLIILSGLCAQKGLPRQPRIAWTCTPGGVRCNPLLTPPCKQVWRALTAAARRSAPLVFPELSKSLRGGAGGLRGSLIWCRPFPSALPHVRCPPPIGRQSPSQHGACQPGMLLERSAGWGGAVSDSMPSWHPLPASSPTCLVFPASRKQPACLCLFRLQVMHSSKVYLKLNERLGLSDHSTVLNVMLRWDCSQPCHSPGTDMHFADWLASCSHVSGAIKQPDTFHPRPDQPDSTPLRTLL